MNCPICNTPNFSNDTVCSNCLYDSSKNEMLNELITYKCEWLVKKARENGLSKIANILSVHPSITQRVVANYTTEKSHKYYLTNATIMKNDKKYVGLEINIKYGILAFEEIEGNVKRVYLNVIGNSILDFDVNEDGTAVNVYAKIKNENHLVSTIEDIEHSQFYETAIVLSLIRLAKYIFGEDEFDDTLTVNDSVKNPEWVWDNWFDKEKGIYGITCDADVRHYDDTSANDDEVIFGHCKLDFSFIVEDLNKYRNATLFEKFGLLYKVVVETSNDTQREKVEFSIEELKENLYFEGSNNSIYIGSLYSYTQFKFGTLELAQKVYNYLATLCDSITRIDMMTHYL